MRRVTNMHRLIGIAVFIAFVFLAECQARTKGSPEELIPQIKLTRVEVLYVNPKYFNAVKSNIYKHNATYNKIHLDLELIQDLSPDVVVNINVYVTNSKYEEEKLLLQESVPLCKDSPKRHLWKLSQRLSKYKQTECMKKGSYAMDDSGSFRFDLEIPNIHEISDYHYTTYVMLSGNEIVCEVKGYTEWGYLNTS